MQFCNTANLCAVDLSKAFDKVNHDALLLKLMKRCVGLPNELLNILDVWLSACYLGLCAKWHNAWSDMFRITFGVRQGSIYFHHSYSQFTLMISLSYVTERKMYLLFFMQTTYYYLRHL